MTASFSLDGEKIKIPCPHCRKNLEVTVRQLKTSPEVKCPACGNTTKLEASKFKKDNESIEQSMRGLQRQLGNLFKK